LIGADGIHSTGRKLSSSSGRMTRLLFLETPGHGQS
jgi:hypothetical protein